MKKNNLFLSILLTVFFLYAKSQSSPGQAPQTAHPKLIVGIVVDQMRYDYLYRFADKFGKDGFQRLMKEGYNCRNTNYNYTPTYTGPGHASVYTGTTPSMHGIIANNWYDRVKSRNVYCSEDKSVNTVGAKGNAGQMSPVSMLGTTITDEVHIASNLNSKVIGIALKDRGAILPAGHTANAAYWYDASGAWISSTYYMNKLPAWVTSFNEKKHAESYLSQNWNTLLPIEQYTESTADSNAFEALLKGETSPVFPHKLPALMAANGGADLIRNTPFGNSLTKDFAIQTIMEEHLGKGVSTDFLTISFSSTDYIGHSYGPHSIELEDTYLRLDKDLAELLTFLDKELGKGNVLLFLTADHAVVDVPLFLTGRKIPAGNFEGHPAIDSLKQYLKKKYADSTLVQAFTNQQIYLNQKVIARKEIQKEQLQQDVADFMLRFNGVAGSVTASAFGKGSFNSEDMRSLIQNGYQPKRSGDVMIILQPGWIESESLTGTTHGSGYSYDTHVPLLWYGWNVHPGSTVDCIRPIDIAPTISMMLNIPFPDACSGKPIPSLANPPK
jgi:predicted AlkP superfamily pyrophosphatase or phosphodiesterase